MSRLAEIRAEQAHWSEIFDEETAALEALQAKQNALLRGGRVPSKDVNEFNKLQGLVHRRETRIITARAELERLDESTQAELAKVAELREKQAGYERQLAEPWRFDVRAIRKENPTFSLDAHLAELAAKRDSLAAQIAAAESDWMAA